VLVDGVAPFTKLNFSDFQDRRSVAEGTPRFKINLAGTATTVLEGQLNLEKDVGYSVVAFDTPAALKVLVLKDATTVAFAGARGYIRIANLISDAVGTPEFTGSSSGGAAFGAAANYGETSLGSKSVGVKYTTANGTGAASVGFELESGNFYTVYAIGSADRSKGKPVRLIVSRDSKP
jgi:Domain of unknown function (DUF4397)